MNPPPRLSRYLESRAMIRLASSFVGPPIIRATAPDIFSVSRAMRSWCFSAIEISRFCMISPLRLSRLRLGVVAFHSRKLVRTRGRVIDRPDAIRSISE